MKGRTVAASVIALLLASLAVFESGGRYILTPYRDIGGVWTVCDGITGDDVIPYKTYTVSECDALNAKAVKKHFDEVVRLCGTSVLDAPDRVQFAVGHLAYNVGPSAVCRTKSGGQSTIAREIEARNYGAVCDAIIGRYYRAGGKDCRIKENRCGGIIKRREYEAGVCSGEVDYAD